MIESQLLPAVSGLRLIDVEFDSDRILVKVEMTSAMSPCPRCHEDSQRIHSRYERKLTDLPWAGKPVRMLMHVRRFLCRNKECPQRVFCERLAPAIAVYARQTERVKAQILTLALAMGGELRARILPQLGLWGTPAMLLNHIRNLPAKVTASVRVVGMDDWAKRKGQVYGTILVDLERRKIVDLLDDRTTTTAATWLAEHPEIEVISRDRYVNYAKAAAEGAPNAVQVADRFHLLKNMNEAVQRTLDRNASVVRQVTRMEPESPPQTPPSVTEATAVADVSGVSQIPADPVPADEGPVNLAASPTQPIPAQAETRTAQRFKEVKALQQKGLSERAIARQLGLSRRTVRRYAVHDNVPVRTLAPQSTSTVTPYLGCLRSRIAEGCDNYATLHQEIASLGYKGSYASVRRALLPLLADRRSAEHSQPPAAAPKTNANPLSSRQAAWLLVRRREKLKPDEIELLEALCKSSTTIATLQQLAQDFHRIVRERRSAELDPWLTRAHTSGISEMRHFAEGLVRDFAAVKSALQLPWSNGPVEGCVNKLKLLKRQQYGRGNLDLLRLRLVYAP